MIENLQNPMNFSKLFVINCCPSLLSPCCHSCDDRQIQPNIQIEYFPFSVSAPTRYILFFCISRHENAGGSEYGWTICCLLCIQEIKHDTKGCKLVNCFRQTRSTSVIKIDTWESKTAQQGSRLCGYWIKGRIILIHLLFYTNDKKKLRCRNGINQKKIIRQIIVVTFE